MKNLFTFVFSFILTISVIAQSPHKMSYQAVIHDATNNLLLNQVVGIKISILQGSVSGNAVYIETQTPTTNDNGLISLEIGGGIVSSGSFSTLDWANGPYFIKTEIDPTGGTNYTISGTTQLLSVPYALYAEKSGTSLSGDGTKVTAGTNITVTGSGSTDSPYVVNATGISNTHFVGENYGGGIVYYLYYYENMQHGLIVSSTDLSTGVRWYGGTNTNTMAYGVNTQAGKANTTLIIANQGYADGETYAARICNEYSSGGYGDWYLPSSYELTLLINERRVDGLADDCFYWSSTESNSESAWCSKRMGISNIELSTQKYTLFHVRAIRAF